MSTSSTRSVAPSYSPADVEAGMARGRRERSLAVRRMIASLAALWRSTGKSAAAPNASAAAS